MNICMVVHAYYPHDESRVHREALALQENGCQVDVICLRKGNEPVRGCHDGVSFYRLPARRTERLGLAGYILEYGKFFLLAAARLLTLHQEKRYRVIQFHNPPDPLVFAGLIPKLLGAKLILDIHDLTPELYAAKSRLREGHWLIQLLTLIERFSCRFADHVFTVTEAWRDQLLQRGVGRGKCSVLMNLPDERLFKPQELESPTKSVFNIVYHGTLVNRYGVDIAVNAVSILKDSIPEIRLNIIGEGEELERLIRLSRELSVEDRVYFSKGFAPVTTIPGILAEMDIGIVPNRLNDFTKDVLNAKLLEYVAMGLPVVVSRTPGVERYFDESMVSFFEPGNAEELAETILLLYRDKEERARLVKNAGNVLKRHSWAGEKKRYCGVILLLTRQP
jgi:glycosyltransferase involved in cell wall biosynthesis